MQPALVDAEHGSRIHLPRDDADLLVQLPRQRGALVLAPLGVTAGEVPHVGVPAAVRRAVAEEHVGPADEDAGDHVVRGQTVPLRFTW